MAEAISVELLPVSGAVLASDARVLLGVRAIGERVGFDYTDDAAVTALLTERLRAVEAAERSRLHFLATLTLMAAVILPFLPSTAPRLVPEPALAYAAAAVLLLVSVGVMAVTRSRWKRALHHPALDGYREVLGVARAHGLPLTHVPAWLEGRSLTSGSSGGSARVPTYERVEPMPATQPTPPTAAVPPKPAAVTSYESIADKGDWHDEAGCLMVLAGALGVIWAATSDRPIGYGALVLVPLVIATWLAGRRQGREKERLKEQAVAYVKAVAAAQTAGAPVPELSPVLRKLLDEGPAVSAQRAETDQGVQSP
ncbi:hypothetical protein ACWCPM_19670 [Streptomyces sp. NPDC002309]